jgi:hypothetical protein
VNCAPITVTAGSKKRDVNVTEYDSSADSVFGKRDATFPEMFVANLGDGCKTVDNVDVEFPNPGSVLQKAGSAAPVPPQGTVSHSLPSIFYRVSSASRAHRDGLASIRSKDMPLALLLRTRE